MGAAKHHQDWDELLPNKISRAGDGKGICFAGSIQSHTLQRKLQSSIRSSFDFLSTPLIVRSIPALISCLFPIGGSWAAGR